MSARVLVLVLVVVAAAVSAAPAQAQQMTKREVVERASPICADAERATKPHLRRLNRAEKAERPRAMARHGHRMVRAARRPIRRLAALIQPGHDRYRRFVSNLRGAFAALDGAFDALEGRRYRLALRRAKRAERRIDRAIGAGRRYGLRKPCV